MTGSASDYYQYQQGASGLITALSLRIRRRMFAHLMDWFHPRPETTVLDVGFTADDRPDSNFFERLYPHPRRIVAISTEPFTPAGRELADDRCVRADGAALPFPDRSFDLVVSFATLEHVGSRERQATLVRELCRVGRRVCITIPNRWYPIEFHTVLPLAHWLPLRHFRTICRWLGREFYAREETLNPLSKNDVLAMVPAGRPVSVRRFWLFCFISNYMLCLGPDPSPSR